MFASTRRFGAAVGVINRVEVKPLSKILARLLASLPNKASIAPTHEWTLTLRERSAP